MKKVSNAKFSWFLAIFLLLPIGSICAQDPGGILAGTCVDVSTGAPLPGVTVRAVIESDSTSAKYTYTNSVGKYRLSGLPSGKYYITYSLLGYQDVHSKVDVYGTEPAMMNIAMTVQPLESQDVVVTADRHEEKETHAPASMSVVSQAEIRDQVDATPTDALKNIPGIAVASEGIAMSTYAGREFHSVYGSDMLTMNDYHALEVPALAVYYGILMPQTMDDIDHIEVVRGPGSALYGPEAATGVVNFISKSPFASQGTNLSISGGERDYINASFRHDEAIGDKFAFTVSGHYLSANDWHVADDPKEDVARDSAQAALHSQPVIGPPLSPAAIDSLSRIGNRDYNLQVYSFNARADANLSDDLMANITAGLSNIVNDIAMTEDFGDAQIKNWEYSFVQARVNYKDLFIQGSVNHDNTYGSYFLPTGDSLVDKSSTYVAQIQDHIDPFSHEKLTFGADYKAIVPISDNTLYGPDDGHANTQILGAYVQSQTSLLDDALEIDLAGRLDKDYNQATNLTPIFSPRAAAVYHFDDNNLVRAMYNNTYLLPTEVDIYADLLYSAGIYNVRYVSPYVSGYTFAPPNADGSYNINTPLPALDGMPQVPSTMTTAQAQAKLWPVLMDYASKQPGSSPLLKLIPAPSQSITYLSYRNLNTGLFDSIGAPTPISAVQPQHQRTFEIDYQGAVSKSFQFEVDAYQTHYTAIRASTAALTPTLSFDSSELQQYFKGIFTSAGVAKADSSAQVLAGDLAKLPLGVVEPQGGALNPAYADNILVGTRGYLTNVIEFYGVDFFSTYKANEEWSFDGSFSWLNQNYWYAGALNPQDSTNQSPFALNLPKYRASVGARYSGLAKGLSVELRDRWSDAFQMNDSYWIGDVASQHVVDLTVNYRIESWNSLQLTLAITNVLNNLHQEFVGAPEIGRLTVLRAAYTLPPF